MAQNSLEKQHVETQWVFDARTGWETVLGRKLVGQVRAVVTALRIS